MRRAVALLPLLIFLATLTLACGEGDPGAPQTTDSFYIEATVEVIPHGDTELFVTEIVWWFESRGRWRWEMGNDDGVWIGVSDGQHWWFYNPRENAYTMERLPPGATEPFLPISLWLGPVGPGSIDEFVDYLESLVDSEGWVARAGEEQLLGRDVVVIEFAVGIDAITAGSKLPEEVRDTASLRDKEDVSRVWVDAETMFVLRHEITGEQSAAAWVTLLELDGDFRDELFEFEPPEGAVLTD